MAPQEPLPESVSTLLASEIPEGAQRLALLHSPAQERDRLMTALALDARLARIAGQTSEVMLGQMRLAWWRDMLAGSAADRPAGDAVLDAIGLHWAGREGPLGAMVDGWEVLVASDEMQREQILEFGQGRAAPFAALAPDEKAGARAECAAMRWAIADAAANLSDDAERDRFIETGLSLEAGGGRLPRSLKGLGVLEALAIRSLKRGGCALMEGRGAALTAMQAAILGA